jgi:hypothetical protein
MLVSPELWNTNKGKLVQNKPMVVDPSTYELAARGYSAHQDILHRNLHSLEDVLNMVNTISGW